VTEAEDLDIERKVLEAIERYENQREIHGVVFGSLVCREFAFPIQQCRWRCDLLRDKGEIELVGMGGVGEHFGLKLTPKGRLRLSRPEHEYRKSIQQSGGIQNHVTVQGDVQNLAQSFGPNSPITQSAENNAVLAKLSERLLREIADNSKLTPTEKLNAEIEAQQLQLELRKPAPSTDKIRTAISFLVAYAPLVIDLMKPYLLIN
jgi:hypothetical protein